MKTVLFLLVVFTLLGMIGCWYLTNQYKGLFSKRVLFLPLILSIGFIAGCGSGDESAAAIEEMHAENETLQLSVAEMEEEVEELLSKIEEYEELLDEQTEVIAAQEKELESLSNEISIEELEEKDKEIAQLKKDIETSETDIKNKNLTISSLEKEVKVLSEAESTAKVTESSSESEIENSCSPGTISINTASFHELQGIHQIGPDRAQQIIDMRSNPFTSYNSLTRISGIGDKRVVEIEQQGIICFD
ncbi:helix-hairpin-helix domain-containing protein [Alkalihalobacillus sp. 1P02AB]|uniref:helix-hairpin-helix domain-containing protein n=1 Tax=Alkalihalobacillus sp. 1P02AB TaxID=3132260 RepID=UPI0039A4FA68